MRITNVFFIFCAAISIAYLKLTPVARERVLAFKKLNPKVRSFQVIVQDSQEVSSASATMSSKYPYKKVGYMQDCLISKGTYLVLIV